MSKFENYVRLVALLFSLVFILTVLHLAQLSAAPLRNPWTREYYNRYQVYIKRLFGQFIIGCTAWYIPTHMRICGDESVKDVFTLSPNDTSLHALPGLRCIVMANHQLYSDWLYLWWIAYVCGHAGNVKIILKESLRKFPVVGVGMRLFNFIFLSRKWTVDQPRLVRGLNFPSTPNPANPSPLWLLLFPEGTNLSANGRTSSARWAAQTNQPDLHYCLLPRSRGLYTCLKILQGSTRKFYLYDCTIIYKDYFPRFKVDPKTGKLMDDEDHDYSLDSLIFHSRAPTSVAMYWRRFPVSSIPIDDEAKFTQWLQDRWREKDTLIHHYKQKGNFPEDEASQDYSTPLRLYSPVWPFILQLTSVCAFTCAIIWYFAIPYLANGSLLRFCIYFAVIEVWLEYIGGW